MLQGNKCLEYVEGVSKIGRFRKNHLLKKFMKELQEPL